MAQHPHVVIKSPLDILGIFLVTIRERFIDPGEDFPWVWKADPKDTTLFIEAGAGDETNMKDARPAIYVDRGTIIFPKVVIGDFAGEQRHTGIKGFFTTGTGQMTVDCVSKNRGESAILGDLVQTFILMSSDEILKAHNLRDITPVTLGATEIWEKDERLFNTRVTSEIVFDIKWTVTPVVGGDRTKISGIDAKLSIEGSDAYHEIAVNSLNR